MLAIPFPFFLFIKINPQLGIHDINLTSIDRDSILHTGLILIGVVIVIYGITAFLGSVIAYFSYRDIVSTPIYYQQHERMISSIFRAILGVILIFKSVPIARFFDKRE